MRIAMLSPITWRTPPKDYGPVEGVVSALTERLVANGADVTLFATADSITSANLTAAVSRSCSENPSADPGVSEYLHVSELFEKAERFDLIHNHMGALPLAFSGLAPTPMITTLHQFISSNTLSVYKKYNGKTTYVAVSESGKNPELDYAAAIPNGIDIARFSYSGDAGDYLLVFGGIDRDSGVEQAVELARRSGHRLVIAGAVLDKDWFKEKVEPQVDGAGVMFLGVVEAERRAEVLGGALAILRMGVAGKPYSLSMLEAMACGRPVIAMGDGAAVDAIADGETGFIVSSVDEAASAIGRLGEIERAACRRRVEEMFTVDRMADSYMRLYRETLDKRENHRPWGHYENLVEDTDHKMKRIVVKPGQRLSYQKHNRRAEHWVVIRGEAIVTLDGEDIKLSAGQSVDIPKGAAHRVTNPGDEPMIFGEVQMGDYFGEDDIIRLEDDYGRTS